LERGRRTGSRRIRYSLVDKAFGSGSLVPRMDSALRSSTAPISITRYTPTIGQSKSVMFLLPVVAQNVSASLFTITARRQKS
jgi:hypothetical protein